MDPPPPGRWGVRGGCGGTLRKGKKNKLQNKIKKYNAKLRRPDGPCKRRRELDFAVCKITQLDSVCSKPEPQIAACAMLCSRLTPCSCSATCVHRR